MKNTNVSAALVSVVVFAGVLAWWLGSGTRDVDDSGVPGPGKESEVDARAATALARPDPVARTDSAGAGPVPGSSVAIPPSGVGSSAAGSGERTPQAPAEPPSYLGLADRSNPILGGGDAIARFHADSRAEVRKERLEALRAILAQYVDGDPRDPLEFEQYQALKDELRWLEANLLP